ncbi:DUF397 domain-containing protein [Actinosynnema sp. CS-041913]|uniref:DUF397 domain-containing protein n=1 Tax=Actinosynnema sp. CS-041913 TaxID=3239917 RepID=UPI003D938B88
MTSPGWRKSSRSGAATNCVEVRADLGAIRDSKQPDGPELPFRDAHAVKRFVSAYR